MTDLPPPRPPGAPPLGPPIRRPDDHLPRPEHVPGPPPSVPAPPTRRLALLALALAALGIAIAAGSYALATRGGADGFDTTAAAATVDGLLGDETPPSSCPVDDIDDVLARAFDEVDSDAVYDTIDLGTARTDVTGRDHSSSVTCQVSMSSPATEAVGMTLSADPDGFIEEIEFEAPPGIELERSDGPHGGTIVRAAAPPDGATPAGVLVAWTNDDLAVSVYAFGAASDDVGLDELQAGLEDVLPDVVDDLAADPGD